MAIVLTMFSCQKPEPVVMEYFPNFGPPETLVTVKGENFIDITRLDFDDQVPADFNPSYGAEHAILFRVPLNAPLGDNTVIIETSGGRLELPFKVTLEAPQVLDFYPASAPIGGTVTILGENFFEPLEVLFYDSLSAEILHLAEDSIVVQVPEGTEKGFIKVKANGGNSSTNKKFFATIDHLVSDFDGQGIHDDISKWLFYGSINEIASTAIQGDNPQGIDGSFLKISGKDENSIWLGGTEHASFDATVFDVYDIQSSIDETFLEFDANNNGNANTTILFILKERNGSFNDFTSEVAIDWAGWEAKSIPLNRFKDVDGITINPADIKVVKIHLINPDNLDDSMEVNIDNLKFVEVN